VRAWRLAVRCCKVVVALKRQLGNWALHFSTESAPKEVFKMCPSDTQDVSHPLLALSKGWKGAMRKWKRDTSLYRPCFYLTGCELLVSCFLASQLQIFRVFESMCRGVRRKEGIQCIWQGCEEGVQVELLFGFRGSRLRSNDTITKVYEVVSLLWRELGLNTP